MLRCCSPARNENVDLMLQTASEAGVDVQTTRRSLLFHRNFRLLWAGESTSLVGSAVSYVAFPLVAVLTLRASAFELGALTMAGKLPPLLFGALGFTYVVCNVPVSVVSISLAA